MASEAEELSDEDEVMLRNVHPDWIQDGKPTSAVFRPTQKDNGKLSVDRSSVTDASGSYHLHTVEKGLASEAVYGVSVGEFSENLVKCYPDPITGNLGEVENKAHALADFSTHGTSKQEKIGKKLKRKAIERGKLHP